MERIPKIIIHGGYVNESNMDSKPARQASIQHILKTVYQKFEDDVNFTAQDAVILCVTMLEDDPLFNAGTGARIQADGKIRLTSSYMDSVKQKLSGVLNIENVKNPCHIARQLQDQAVPNILAADGALQYARNHGYEYYNPETRMRRAEWEATQQKMNINNNIPKTGTVGAVALDCNGVIATCTSTGGTGFELMGRVSDSGNCAGNYCNKVAGVSITGIGEDAMSVSMASAICIRRKDGCTLQEALDKTIVDLEEINGVSGAICLDIDGNFAYRATVGGMCWGLHDGKEVKYFQ